MNSNVILKNNIFSEYLNSIKSNFPAIGYAGKIQYESQDKAFESYLNTISRYKVFMLPIYSFLLGDMLVSCITVVRALIVC